MTIEEAAIDMEAANERLARMNSPQEPTKAARATRSDKGTHKPPKPVLIEPEDEGIPIPEVQKLAQAFITRGSFVEAKMLLDMILANR